MTQRLLFLSALILFVFGPNAGHADTGKLYVAEVDESTGTKPLQMRFEEIERAPRYSVAQVTYRSGASVASSMYVVRGMWEIARIRGAPFFIKLKEWTAEDGKQFYKVGFAESDQVEVQSYFGESPSGAGFLSVKEFALIFGD